MKIGKVKIVAKKNYKMPLNPQVTYYYLIKA